MNGLLERIKYLKNRMLRPYYYCKNSFYSRALMGYCHPTVQINYPVHGLCKQLYYHEYTKIQPWTKFIIAPDGGKVIWKKYSSGGIGLTVISGNHCPTVGIPQFFLGPTHVNDIEKDIIVEEDVWLGANITILAGAHIGRGCVVGACSLINKEYPPYAVLGGVPAKIIAVKFSIEQILEHEKALYKEEERFSREYLEELFERYYKGLKIIGTSKLSEEDKKKIERFKEDYDYRCKLINAK